MVDGVKRLAAIGTMTPLRSAIPGRCCTASPSQSRTISDVGWVGFDFEAAFGKPVKVVNDAAMQALGSYRGGKMLFLGLGTGWDQRLSSTASSSRWNWRTFRIRKATYEDYVGERGLNV